MCEKYDRGVAFILEGDTEKEFYMALLNFLCKKHRTSLERQVKNESSPDIVYSIETPNGVFLIKFNVVNAISQVPRAGKWFLSQCYKKYPEIDTWNVFLCYDTDCHKDTISKFREGDWDTLRKQLKNKAQKVADMAAAADIEDLLLQDINGISNFLGSSAVLNVPTGRKGKTKMKKLYRSMNKTYHEGARAREMIDSLDMQLIIDSDFVPLKEIELAIFK